MGPIGWPELLVLLVIVLIIFGGTRLAGLGKASGRAIREFKEETKGLNEKDAQAATPPQPQQAPPQPQPQQAPQPTPPPQPQPPQQLSQGQQPYQPQQPLPGQQQPYQGQVYDAEVVDPNDPSSR